MAFEALDANKFKNFFDIDQRLINEHEFRKSIFKGIFLHVIKINKFMNFDYSWRRSKY
jgi:hypothetical protein